jgi:serine/threonine protein kinase
MVGRTVSHYQIVERLGAGGMGYVSGKALDQLIPRKGMRLNEALKIAGQVADAMARAHEAGTVHRDLKPSNLMVDERGSVKVVDFGLAKLAETGGTVGDATTRTEPVKTEEGAIVGTVAYMSPEQAEGRALDGRSDIFSFGAVLYEMVTGRRAFSGDTAVSTLASVIKDHPKPLSEVAPDTPHDLEKLISRCLQKQPDRRWQAMADLRVALGELREESDSGGGRAAPVPAKAGSRWRWAALAVVTLVIISGAWLL